jgi:hypothetical protein
MFQAYISNVSNVLEVDVASVFHTDVAKVVQNIAYIVMVVHVCCKRLSPMFHLFSRRVLQVCFFGYCIYFTHILLVFYLNVVYVCNVFLSVFSSVSYAYFKCFICLFFNVASIVFK